MGTWIFGYGSLIHKPGFAYTRRVEGHIRGYRRVWWQGSTDHRGTPEVPGRTVTLTPDPHAVTWGAAFELAGTPEEQQQVIQYLEWREKQYDVRLTLPVYAANPEAAGNASQSTAGAAAGGNAAAGTPAAAAAAATNSQTAAAEGGQPAAAAVDGQAGAASTRAAAEGAQPAVAAAVVYYATDNPATNVNFLGPAPQDAIAAQIAAAVGPSGPNYEYVYKLADAMRQMGVDDPDLYELEGRVRTIRGDPPPAAAASVQPPQPVASTATAAAAAAVQQTMTAAVSCDVHMGREQHSPPAAGTAAAAVHGSAQAAALAPVKAQSASVLELTATCTGGSWEVAAEGCIER